MPFDGTERNDPYSIETFIKWLETKPAMEHYDYMDVKGHCLLGQYANEMNEHRLKREEKVNWKTLNWDVKYGGIFDEIAREFPRTFGAALARAKALQSHKEG